MPLQPRRIHQLTLVRELLLAFTTFQTLALALPITAFGQSDPSNFTTVINVPPDPAPGAIGSSTQLNVSDGGKLPSGFVADFGSELNISGGSVDRSFNARSGSVVNISGGTIGTDFDVLFGSDVELFGGEFRLNGAEFTGNVITLSGNDVFTGTLADGSSFIFSPLAAEVFEGVSLTAALLPPLDTTPIIVDVSTSVVPTGLRAGQSLTVREGGILGESFSAIDATLNFEGGTVGTVLDGLEVTGSTVNVQQGTISRLFAFFESEVNIMDGTVGEESRAYAGSEINISGGSVGRRFDAYSGSVVNIRGGSVGDSLRAFEGSEVNISGGTVGGRLRPQSGSVVNISGGSVGGIIEAEDGSEMNISGGSIGSFITARSGSVFTMSGGAMGRRFDARQGSELTISGGTVGRQLIQRSGSNVELIGGEFRLNGAEYTENTIWLSSGDVFTGTLADGSVFLFSPLSGDRLRGATLTVAPLPAIDTTPITINAAHSAAPPGLRYGQSLTLRRRGALGNDFAAVNATLNIEGGTIGENLEVAGSTANISSGTIGAYFEANSGSVIDISGGSIGPNFNANFGTVVNMSGGSIGQNFAATDGSVVNISGGSFGDSFDATSGSEINLFGTDFMLDGVLLEPLPFGQSVEITDRNVTLAGVLADGSEFSFFLLARSGTANGYFAADATLTVTLVPEPSSLVLVAAFGVVFIGLRGRRTSNCSMHDRNFLER